MLNCAIWKNSFEEVYFLPAHHELVNELREELLEFLKEWNQLINAGKRNDVPNIYVMHYALHDQRYSTVCKAEAIKMLKKLWPTKSDEKMKELIEWRRLMNSSLDPRYRSEENLFCCSSDEDM